MAKLLLQFSGVERCRDRAARSSILRLIALSGTIGTLAAKRATTSIPVVMLTIEGLPAPNCSICLLYSADLNPIEQVFAKLKALLRKIAAGPAFTFRYLFGCRMRRWAHLDGS